MTSCRVEVAIKARPPLAQEREQQVLWDVRNYVVARAAQQQQQAQLQRHSGAGLKRKRADAEKFYFDYIFNTESTNYTVFDKVAKNIVSSAVEGYNGTVIAYGQRNSGKTYTMLGTENDRGVIPLAVEYMFDMAKKMQDRKLAFRVSYFEIHNEKINDLIDVNNTNLKVSQSVNNLVQIMGCKEEVVTDAESVHKILKDSELNRKIHENPMNQRSDKSHTILRINIENKDIENRCDLRNRFSQLNLVDLAGHKAVDSHQSKDDFHINISLSLLSLIIVQLNKTSDTQKCINYGQTKLTQCLPTSFGGNAKTAFICTISLVSSEETQSTLWFAFRASNLRNKPKLNTMLFYKLQLVSKICRFHKFLKVKMKKLLDKLIQLQEENRLAAENNVANSRVSRVMSIINSNRDKFALDLMVPVLDEDDVFSALQQFKQDLEKLHDKLAYLADYISTNEDILNLLQNIECDLEHLEPKAVLLETFINILIED